MDLAIRVAIAALFLLMAARAVSSGSATDYLIAASLIVGLLLLLTPLHAVGLYLLLPGAGAYLLSQVLTGARPVSRLLPVAGAALVALALF